MLKLLVVLCPDRIKMPETIGHFNQILSGVRLLSYTLEHNKLHICNYCMIRRAIQGNILLEADNTAQPREGQY